MISVTDAILFATFVAFFIAAFGVAFEITTTPALERPRLGMRGMKRASALEAHGLFALVEPMLRFIGSWFGPISLERLRAAFDLVLVRSGQHLGLSADEALAASLLCGLFAGGAGAWTCSSLGWPAWLAAIAALLGLVMPWLRLRGIARDRARSINQSLPSVLELSAMCMSAGLDFPSSLRCVVGSAVDANEPIVEELARVLQELDFGHSRRSAMERFAERVPTEQARELVSAIVQAEHKGSPLGPVLAIQAQTQRLRRSTAAEEAASEAALMLLGPMTLIFLCVIVLLLGPVVVRLMAGGIGAQ